MASHTAELTIPTKYISTTPAIMQCEAATLVALNNYLAKYDDRYYFNNYEEFKHMQDNSGSDKSTIFQYIDDEFYTYVMETITDQQFEELLVELDINSDVEYKDPYTKRDAQVIRATNTLLDKLIRPLSPFQFQMMEMLKMMK